MVAEPGLTVPVTFLQGCAVTVVGVQALEWSVSGCLCCVHCSFCTRWNDLLTTEPCS